MVFDNYKHPHNCRCSTFPHVYAISIERNNIFYRLLDMSFCCFAHKNSFTVSTEKPFLAKTFFFFFFRFPQTIQTPQPPNMNSTVLNQTATNKMNDGGNPASFSGKHNGLYLYFTRIMRYGLLLQL